MSETFNELLASVGSQIAKNIIQSQIVYPRTLSLGSDKAMIQLPFDGTLLPAIQKIENSIELKAIDAVKDSVTVLKLIEEFKNSLLLEQADYVVIYKGGFDVVKLENAQKPNSGRSLYIELNSARNELIRYIEAARGKSFPWLQVGTGIGVGIIILFNILRSFRRD